MKVNFKLYASLAEYLPAGAVRNAVEIEVPDAITPNALIDRYRVPREFAHLVLINGRYCGHADRDTQRLRDGDTLAVWPPVAGG